MKLVGIVLIPRDELVRADLERYGVQRTVEIPLRDDFERLVARAAKGEHVMLFASPRRRWAQVVDSLRAAISTVGGDVMVRFYQPTCLLAVRSRITSGEERYGLCVSVEEFESGQGSKAYAMRRAVKDGIADLLAQEMTQLVGSLKPAEAA